MAFLIGELLTALAMALLLKSMDCSFLCRFLADHKFLFCGGKRVSCFNCGEFVPLRDMAKHAHEDCSGPKLPARTLPVAVDESQKSVDGSNASAIQSMKQANETISPAVTPSSELGDSPLLSSEIVSVAPKQSPLPIQLLTESASESDSNASDSESESGPSRKGSKSSVKVKSTKPVTVVPADATSDSKGPKQIQFQFGVQQSGASGGASGGFDPQHKHASKHVDKSVKVMSSKPGMSVASDTVGTKVSSTKSLSNPHSGPSISKATASSRPKERLFASPIPEEPHNEPSSVAPSVHDSEHYAGHHKDVNHSTSAGPFTLPEHDFTAFESGPFPANLLETDDDTGALGVGIGDLPGEHDIIDNLVHDETLGIKHTASSSPTKKPFVLPDRLPPSGGYGMRAEGDLVTRTGLRGAGEIVGVNRTFTVSKTNG